jgi:hypothetical protein
MLVTLNINTGNCTKLIYDATDILATQAYLEVKPKQEM